jgi:IclR family acetate operon transcriptional repressor
MDVEDGPLRSEAGPGYVLRTLAALELLAREPATPDELASALGVHRRTATRLLDVMRDAGWTEAVSDDQRRLHLTTRIISVAGEVLSRTDIVQAGLPFVRELRDRLHESSHLAVPSDGWAVHVIQQPSTQPLNVAVHVGDRVPVHASAVGKALAASLPEQVDIAVDRGLDRFTHNTLTTRDALETELARIREQGFAMDEGELYPDTRCIAAPVRTGFGDVVAAIGISGPAVRLTRDRVEPYAREVMAAADALSATLGYRAKVA